MRSSTGDRRGPFPPSTSSLRRRSQAIVAGGGGRIHASTPPPPGQEEGGRVLGSARPLGYRASSGRARARFLDYAGSAPTPGGSLGTDRHRPHGCGPLTVFTWHRIDRAAGRHGQPRHGRTDRDGRAAAGALAKAKRALAIAKRADMSFEARAEEGRRPGPARPGGAARRSRQRGIRRQRRRAGAEG